MVWPCNVGHETGRLLSRVSLRTMTDTPITPALTAAEWRDLARDPHQHCTDCYASWYGIVHQSGDDWEKSDVTALCTPEDVSRHALAALALYEQPFGFTQADVEVLFRVFHYLRSKGLEADAEDIAAIADRIRALLPPQTKTVLSERVDRE